MINFPKALRQLDPKVELTCKIKLKHLSLNMKFIYFLNEKSLKMGTKFHDD